LWLIVRPSFEYYTCTVLAFNKKWEAPYYYYDQLNDSMVSKAIAKNVNLDLIFSKLVANNVFALPDRENLKMESLWFNPESNEFFGEGFGVTDGTCYDIEFKIGKQV